MTSKRDWHANFYRQPRSNYRIRSRIWSLKSNTVVVVFFPLCAVDLVSYSVDLMKSASNTYKWWKQ